MRVHNTIPVVSRCQALVVLVGLTSLDRILGQFVFSILDKPVEEQRVEFGKSYDPGEFRRQTALPEESSLRQIARVGPINVAQQRVGVPIRIKVFLVASLNGFWVPVHIKVDRLVIWYEVCVGVLLITLVWHIVGLHSDHRLGSSSQLISVLKARQTGELLMVTSVSPDFVG